MLKTLHITAVLKSATGALLNSILEVLLPNGLQCAISWQRKLHDFRCTALQHNNSFRVRQWQLQDHMHNKQITCTCSTKAEAQRKSAQTKNIHEYRRIIPPLRQAAEFT